MSGSSTILRKSICSEISRYSYTCGDEVARSCTAYLSIDALLVGPCELEVDYGFRLEEFVLLEYATVY
jgi:hypothetical protein